MYTFQLMYMHTHNSLVYECTMLDLCTGTDIHRRAHGFIRMYTLLCTYIHVHTLIHFLTHMNVITHAFVYASVCIYVCIHTSV